jgi:hypothetical protein
VLWWCPAGKGKRKKGGKAAASSKKRQKTTLAAMSAKGAAAAEAAAKAHASAVGTLAEKQKVWPSYHHHTWLLLCCLSPGLSVVLKQPPVACTVKAASRLREHLPPLAPA